jgi:hypothetical protein
MGTAKRRPADTARFKAALQSHPDLVHATMYPETDEDILIAIIMRFINQHIFQQIMYGAADYHTDVFNFVETNMHSTVEPKRGNVFEDQRLLLPC